MKNQLPDFEQLTRHARRANQCLNDCTLKLLVQVYIACEHALKLLYVAKGLKYGWYHRHDVIQFSTLVLPKPYWSVGVSNLQT